MTIQGSGLVQKNIRIPEGETLHGNLLLALPGRRSIHLIPCGVLPGMGRVGRGRVGSGLPRRVPGKAGQSGDPGRVLVVGEDAS